MAFVRRRGARVSIYIDDLLNMNQTFTGCSKQESFVHGVFAKGGWCFKPEKSSGPPSQSVQYLGLIINTRSMTFEIPPLKLAKILENALSILTLKFCPVKKLASWVGLLQSCRLAIGPVVSIMCRALYDTIKLAPFWSSNVKLSLSSIFEIKWWRSNLSILSSYPIVVEDTAIKCDASFSSDASKLGFFCYNIQNFQKIKSQPFSLPQSNESSTYRELIAVHSTWTDISICKQFKSLVIKHFTDNKGVVAILGKGSKHPKLQTLVREIFLSFRLYEIVMVPVWLSREHEVIQYADRG